MKKLIQKMLRHIGYKLVSYESLTYNKRFLEIYELFKQITDDLEQNSIEGVYVECGFGFGRSFTVLGHFANRYKRKIYGFDSYEGFPNVLEIDRSSRNPKKGEWAVRTQKEARMMIENLGIFSSNNEFILEKLTFKKDNHNPIPFEKIALLHIDLDLYEGYMYALLTFWDQVQRGGVVVLDEYKLDNWPGATAAVDEFLSMKGVKSKEIRELNGKHFIVKK